MLSPAYQQLTSLHSHPPPFKFKARQKIGCKSCDISVLVSRSVFDREDAVLGDHVQLAECAGAVHALRILDGRDRGVVIEAATVLDISVQADHDRRAHAEQHNDRHEPEGATTPSNPVSPAERCNLLLQAREVAVQRLSAAHRSYPPFSWSESLWAFTTSALMARCICGSVIGTPGGDPDGRPTTSSRSTLAP